MSSTFGSLNIAKSGLMYQQIAIDTANNNIANVNTDGYTRRRAVAAEVGGPGQPTMWSFYDGHGQGVATQSVQRLSDVLLGNRVRKEHANLSYLQAQQTSLERLESSIDEPTDNGVSAALAKFGSAWQDLVSTPDGSAARQSVIAAGQTLGAAITAQAHAIDDEISEQSANAVQDLKDINQGAEQLAQLNHNILLAQAGGTDAGNLEDQRDLLALDLANAAGATVEVDPSNGMYNVKIGDAYLVKGDDAGTLQQDGIDEDAETLTGGTSNQNQVTFSVTEPGATGPTAVVVANGDLGGVAKLLNTTLTGYRGQLNQVVTDLVSVVNAQHEVGFDQNGNQGGAFFTLDPSDPAGSIEVSDVLAKDPTKVAASASQSTDGGGAVVGNNDATNADRLAQVLTGGALVSGGAPGTAVTTDPLSGAPVSAKNISDEYRTMVAGLGATAAGINTQTSNQQLLATQVDDEREQTAGVSLDEETINLMQAQRAYEASSRVLNVMNSILDTLINRTGV